MSMKRGLFTSAYSRTIDEASSTRDMRNLLTPPRVQGSRELYLYSRGEKIDCEQKSWKPESSSESISQYSQASDTLLHITTYISSPTTCDHFTKQLSITFAILPQYGTESPNCQCPQNNELAGVAGLRKS
jgi:hypothetical protein